MGASKNSTAADQVISLFQESHERSEYGAIPVAVAKPASAPSRAHILSTNSVTLGLLKRL